MARSLPDISQKVVANAQGFVNEFQRADNAAKRTAANVNKEVDQLSKSLSRKFTISDIGKDLAKGFGLGSGFAVAQTASELIVAHFARAADEAKKIEASTAKWLDNATKIRRLSQTDEQVLAELQRERERLNKLIPKIDASRYVTGRNGQNRVLKFSTEKEDEQLRETRDAVSDLDLQIAELQKKLQSNTDNQFAAELTRVADAAKRAGKDMAAWKEAGEAEVRKMNDELAEKFREMGDPMRQYREQLREIIDLEAEFLRSNGAHGLNGDDAWKAKVAVWTKIADEAERANRVRSPAEMKRDDEGEIVDAAKRADEEMAKVQSASEQFEQHMAMMWANVSDRAGQAFADMVLTGESSFGDLVDIVARSVLEIAAQLLIINPVLNGIFGGMSGFSALPAAWGFGGGRARGGAVEPGFAYRVNEDGQEFFRPNVGGTVMPVGASRRGDSGGGNTYIIDARGTDESVVARLEQALMSLAGPGVVERRALASVGDARRRGIALA